MTISSKQIKEDQVYTKAEVDALIEYAVEQARQIDEASMAKHNREATVISMILGFTTLALFVDGLLRMLGIIPPFMEIDINIIDNISDKVETDLIPIIKEFTTTTNMIPLLLTSASLLNFLFYIYAIGFVIALGLEQFLKVRPLSPETTMNERNMFIVQSNRKYLWRQTWVVNINWFVCNLGLYFLSRNLQPVTDNFWQGI
ncbi:MAG: hypothetical protein CM15mV2_1540 [uncultured marine virus]|nr:MAG: hypothetical protein CM15mV2_1540 [uncultured marine virus]